MENRGHVRGDAVPRLPKGVRLKFDAVRESWMLLAPERILKPDPIALEILKRCDGVATLDAIVDDLARTFREDRAVVAGDVAEFIEDLQAKRVLEL